MADKETAPPAPAEPGKEAEKKPPATKGVKGVKSKLLLSNLTPREKLVVKVCVIAVALLFLDIIIIHPISGHLRRIDETIRMKETLIPKRLLILKHRQRIFNEERSLKPYFTPSAVSQEEEIAQLLREVERVSKEVNLFVSNINPVNVVKKNDSAYELTVDIEGKGGVDAVHRFIRTLEASNPPVRLVGFSLKPQTKDAEEVKFLFTIAKLGVRENSAAPPPPA